MSKKDFNNKHTEDQENVPEMEQGLDNETQANNAETGNQDDVSGSRIANLEEELADIKDKYVRQVAEFDNFRKRTAKEKIELIQTAGKDIITSLLDVLDDCDRAQKQLDNTEDEALKTGVVLVFNKLRSTLLAKGLKEMVSIGEEFNPDLHEAVAEIPAPSEKQKGTILDEVMKGYFINDKIIRHAKVVVGK